MDKNRVHFVSVSMKMDKNRVHFIKISRIFIIFEDFSSKFVDFGEISTKKRENLTKNREIANGTLLRALHQMDTVKMDIIKSEISAITKKINKGTRARCGRCAHAW